MGFLLFLSDLMVPLIIFYIVGFGILGKRQVFDDFLWGAKEGMGTVVQVVPSLVGLMTAVGVLRASGFLEFLSQIFPGSSGANYPYCICASDFQLRRCGSVIGLV